MYGSYLAYVYDQDSFFNPEYPVVIVSNEAGERECNVLQY